MKNSLLKIEKIGQVSFYALGFFTNPSSTHVNPKSNLFMRILIVVVGWLPILLIAAGIVVGLYFTITGKKV